MKITYHVGQHDGGYAYCLDNVWSEPYGTHHQALEAAKAAASVSISKVATPKSPTRPLTAPGGTNTLWAVTGRRPPW